LRVDRLLAEVQPEPDPPPEGDDATGTDGGG